MREEGSKENEGKRSWEERGEAGRGGGGGGGLLKGSIPGCKQEPIMDNRTSVVREREREKRRKGEKQKYPSITGCQIEE